jgi:hypothetical protein
MPHTRTGRLMGIACSLFVMCHLLSAKGCRQSQKSKAVLRKWMRFLRVIAYVVSKK